MVALEHIQNTLKINIILIVNSRLTPHLNFNVSITSNYIVGQ